jgi:hypothetical protein
MKTNVYKSIYINKKTGLEIPPFYIIHKAENIKQANQAAASWLLSYCQAKKRGSDFINQLLKSTKIINIRLKKL